MAVTDPETTPVVWLNLDAGSMVRGYWDQGWLDLLLSGELGHLRRRYEPLEVRSPAEMPVLPGAVVVLPARFHADKLEQVNECLGYLGWVVLILTSDEESTFPFTQLRHPRLRLWVMTPDPRQTYPEGVRFLGEGFARETLDQLRATPRWTGYGSDVLFMGQVTHARRERLRDELERLAARREDLAVWRGFSDSFAAGVPRDVYLREMAHTKIAPAPSGPATADSFRFFEALAAGCVPVADARAEGMPEGYWHTLFAGHHPLPFPILDDWRDLEGTTDRVLASWPSLANRCGAWWLRYQRYVRRLLELDIDAISDACPPATLAEQLTVIVPTSPIPSHPSLAILAETLASVQERLPGCEVIVVADGVRPEQEDRRADYEGYLRNLVRHATLWWENVTPLILDSHHHQALATAEALRLVETPTLLFVEHDTPLVGDIPFDGIVDVVLAGEANVVRLHHEAEVLEPHRHLMLEGTPRVLRGLPFLGTMQWSQRPHVAGTTFYRQILRQYFGQESRTMIEDVMHGVVQTASASGAWGMFRLFMYAPDGDMKRSTHLDGRESDPKFDMVFAYDAEQPEWAPRSTAAVLAAEEAMRDQPGRAEHSGADAVRVDTPPAGEEGEQPGVGADLRDGAVG